MSHIKESFTNVEIIILESDDREERFIYKKIWDHESPLVSVLTLYPTDINSVELDLTSMLIQNNVSKLGYGGYIILNLFSEKRTGKREYNYKSNNLNNSCIIQSVKESEYLVLAYGCTVNKNKFITKRIKELLDLINKEDLTKKIRTLTDDNKIQGFHPLSSKVRKKWILM